MAQDERLAWERDVFAERWPESILAHPADDQDEDLSECIAAWTESGGDKNRHDHPILSVAFTPSHNRERWGDSMRRGSGSAGSAINSARPTETQVLGPVLKLNCGGTFFQTTASTLRNAPYFASMLRYTEEGVLTTTLDESGCIFVDRSGDLFSYILEYLRSGHWILRDRAGDQQFVTALRDEAAFYGLDAVRDCAPLPRITEYATVWQFQNDMALYVDCLEQTIREDPDHQGLFRLCKYCGGLPLDQQTCTKRFKATTHNLQSVIAYFALRGFSLQHVVEGSMITHTTSADGQSRSGCGTQYLCSRLISIPASWQDEEASCTPPSSHRGVRPPHPANAQHQAEGSPKSLRGTQWTE